MPELGITVHLPQRRRKNEIQVSPHQLGESFFRTRFRIAAKQIAIHIHTYLISPGPQESGQKIRREIKYCPAVSRHRADGGRFDDIAWRQALG